ncbi:MAG: aldose 1-epimerase family protein [Actinobacteria bacterium]|nr:aldose 1-epimerase family protein [Actinomycetota bacterium]
MTDSLQNATPPSGRQVEICSGDQRAWIVEVGGGLRAYSARRRELLDGNGVEGMCSSARGQCLVPWPNRIRDGRYEFAGLQQQLPLTEPERRNAIHGLACWENWTVAEHADDRAVMEYLLHPQPGYPHALRLEVEYRLDAGGLTVRTTATNEGASPCPYGAGAHPYLTVGTPSVDSVVLQAPVRTRLTSDERGIPTGVEPVDGSEYDFRRPRPIGNARLDTAYTDLERDDDGRAHVHLASPDGEAAVTFWLDESYRYLMLFTGDPLPDVNRRSLGVEPMTCAPNAFQSGEGLVSLEPGESFAATWGLEPS